MAELDSDVSAPPRLRGERFVLAVDLGTGGPKVGLVSLTGRIAWQDHLAVATRYPPGGGGYDFDLLFPSGSGMVERRNLNKQRSQRPE